MKEHTSTQKEKRFVLLTLLTAAACAALVFWFAVPLKGHTGQTAQPEPMIQAARVDLNTAGLDAGIPSRIVESWQNLAYVS